MLLMNSDLSGPINIGNPHECTILELAELITSKLNKDLNFEFENLPQDDPTQRKPLIELAKKELNWTPKVSISEGLEKTISYFKEEINKSI